MAATSRPVQPSVAAIVVSYRTGPVLFDCLAALLAEPAVTGIVVVDNGNPPEDVARLDALKARHPGRLTVIGEGVNRGFAAGVNLGAAAASAERLLVINPDAVLQAGSVAALEAARLGAAEPCIVGGRIFGPDGHEQRGCRRRRLTLAVAVATFALGGRLLGRLHPGFANINRIDEPAPEGPVPMEAVSGALMYVSKDAFDRLEGFDPGYFLHVEDLDICRRAELAGGRVIYTPHASALHQGATSDAPSFLVERHKAAGFRRYFRKFAATPGERALTALAAPVLTLAIELRAAIRSLRRRRSP